MCLSKYQRPGSAPSLFNEKGKRDHPFSKKKEEIKKGNKRSERKRSSEKG